MLLDNIEWTFRDRYEDVAGTNIQDITNLHILRFRWWIWLLLNDRSSCHVMRHDSQILLVFAISLS
jgi:hypothetical protein